MTAPARVTAPDSDSQLDIGGMYDFPDAWFDSEIIAHFDHAEAWGMASNDPYSETAYTCAVLVGITVDGMFIPRVLAEHHVNVGELEALQSDRIA